MRRFFISILFLTALSTLQLPWNQGKITAAVQISAEGRNATGRNSAHDASLATGSDIGAKINSLVARCGGLDCRIFVPVGNYTFTTPIVLASNVELYGAGEYLSTINYEGSAGTTAIAAKAPTTNVKIHDLQVIGKPETIGTPASYNSNFAISIAGTYSTIDKVHVAHFWGYGGMVNVQGSHNTISNSDLQYGTFCLGLSGSHQTAKHNYLSNHYSAASKYELPAVHYWDGIASEGLSYALIEDNTVEDNGQSGIYEGGNGSVSEFNKIIHNVVKSNWNRGIDSGVTGHVSARNGINSLTIIGNHAIDNLENNIWVICVQKATISSNYTEYTSDYPKLFGQRAANTRSGIAVGDICGASPGDTTNCITVLGNTSIDYQNTAVVGINLNIKATSANNTISNNSNNSRYYFSEAAAQTKKSNTRTKC